ncbi:hypothetical protein A7A78_09205 [Aequorivita soesokkakensis]|jgi:hypothetical protein|uniref:Anti-sigma factor n=1 Tax=Aequorivita soesokkakensis TaxID=1385699 RepID=A0A1A9LGS4_9FLAO|nr:hypothetical protein [Aequorivita soesokkakensis]OAD92094.1 hypothetical protein A7A78_09205 [Aequorivita soesokkakensis]
MARDIKKMFENYTPEPSTPPTGHEARFEAKLEKVFSENISEEKSTSFQWLKIAAVAIVFFAVSFFGYQQLSKTGGNIPNDPKNSVVDTNTENNNQSDTPKLTLADISPDLKKVQDYYMTGINVQLASLKITDENKELVDGYMQRLSELDKEYTALNAELSKVGPTEATVTALIDNLKIRLDLLFKLKNKLKELKNQNNDEFKTIQS